MWNNVAVRVRRHGYKITFNHGSCFIDTVLIFFFEMHPEFLIPEFKGSLRSRKTFNTDSAPPPPSSPPDGQMAVTAAVNL